MTSSARRCHQDEVRLVNITVLRKQDFLVTERQQNAAGATVIPVIIRELKSSAAHERGVKALPARLLHKTI